MKQTTLGKLVSNKSICCFAHKTRLESMGHPCKYIILPRAHKKFVCFYVDPFFFMTFLIHDLHTCHNLKKTFVLGQVLLHGIQDE
jgi:hypothetical protein